MKVEIGKTYYWNRRKYHIVLLFEDCGERYMVVKTWNKYRQWWSYSIEYVEILEMAGIRK